jgi:hypothetical protein
MFSLPGIHDLFKSFAFFTVLAPLGLIINLKKRKYEIPHLLLLTVPIGIGFALLSGDLGRMFFVAYVPVIAYSLVLLDNLFSIPAKWKGDEILRFCFDVLLAILISG